MSDPVDDLILDLLEWIDRRPRRYDEVMEAWRTSCPRLPVWEEANDRGLVDRRHLEGGRTMVSLTEAGWHWVENRRRSAQVRPEAATGDAQADSVSLPSRTSS